jgi:glycosyltransferase involved in cell wall biosynthesis
MREAAALVPTLSEDAEARLLIGPTNSAGQGYRWARATEANLPGVAARSVTLQRPGGADSFRFETDVLLPLRLRPGRQVWREGVLGTFTHVLFESGYSPTSMMTAVADRAEIDRYRRAGIHVGLLFHGSDIRAPDRHAELYPASPYREASELRASLISRVKDAESLIDSTDVPVFVSTPDLLEFVPRAALLPVVVDVDRFTAAADRPALVRERPIVLHAPSNPAIKGTGVIEPVLERLGNEGRIEYRRISGVPNERMPEFIADADVVVDQIRLGAVGVLAAEAMAAGRLVVGHVHERVRARLEGEIPVVDATPETFTEVMDAILLDPERFATIAAAGRGWARARHDGAAAATVLAPFLSARGEGTGD